MLPVRAGLRTCERAEYSRRLLSTLPDPKVSARCGGRSRLPLRGSPGFAPGSLFSRHREGSRCRHQPGYVTSRFGFRDSSQNRFPHLTFPSRARQENDARSGGRDLAAALRVVDPSDSSRKLPSRSARSRANSASMKRARCADLSTNPATASSYGFFFFFFFESFGGVAGLDDFVAGVVADVAVCAVVGFVDGFPAF